MGEFHRCWRVRRGRTSSQFDAAFAFECVHDMPRPVEVLAAIRDATSVADGLVSDHR